jgi:hypothetical protein
LNLGLKVHAYFILVLNISPWVIHNFIFCIFLFCKYTCHTSSFILGVFHLIVKLWSSLALYPRSQDVMCSRGLGPCLGRPCLWLTKTPRF